MECLMIQLHTFLRVGFCVMGFIAITIPGASPGVISPLAQTQDSRLISTRWDSLPVMPITVIDTIDVEARHITIREIIQRAMKGEKTKLAGHDDMTYTSTLRTIVRWKDKKKVKEEVYRSYADTRDRSRHVFLDENTIHYKREGAEWIIKDKKEDDDSRVRVRTSRRNDFSRLPFFLEDDSEFEFKLIDRTLEVDHVVFKIAFRPKSAFKPLPYGVIYISSDRYRVIHEQYHFDKNPAPLFLKDIKRISRHWAELPGGEWVFTKIMGELDLRTDPFGWIPGTVSFALIRNDFRFDEGYDPHLFGDFKGPAVEGTCGSTPAIKTDSTQAHGLLGVLQTNDSEFFPRDLQTIDAEFTSDIIEQHDSLGFDQLMEVMKRSTGRLNFNLGASSELIDYNRVEGLVPAARIGLETIGLDLGFAGGYATASKQFRYIAYVSKPLEFGDWSVELLGNYEDRVVPYGSNLPMLNNVRALMSGADERDYLRREGGSGGVSFEHTSGINLKVSYEAGRETSISTRSDFAFIGNMDQINPPVDEGTDRAVVAELGLDLTGRLRAQLRQRIAGGELGGDFRYNRTDITLDWRRFVIGRHELVARVAGIVTGDCPPVQLLADAGGLSTVRGYERRTRLGRHSLAMRIEHMVPYDLMAATRLPLLRVAHLQLVPWADAGRVWDGNSDNWIHSVGIGVQLYLGAFEDASNLRLDFAFPTRENRRGDVEVFLHFTSGLF
jgi:hypothetical protein